MSSEAPQKPAISQEDIEKAEKYKVKRLADIPEQFGAGAILLMLR